MQDNGDVFYCSCKANGILLVSESSFHLHASMEAMGKQQAIYTNRLEWDCKGSVIGVEVHRPLQHTAFACRES